MKKVLLSSMILFGSFAIAAAQNGKNTPVSKPKTSVTIATTPFEVAAFQTEYKTEAEAKAAKKLAKSSTAPVVKTRPVSALSLKESQQ